MPDLLYLIFASVTLSLVCAQFLTEEDKDEEFPGILMLNINVFS